MAAPKNHHLLPAFYLRGFCNREIHERENHARDQKRCSVWVYDETRQTCGKRGVKNVATERHFYSADMPEGGHDPEPERRLSALESQAAPIIKGLRHGKELSGPERARLARFVAVMMARTPSFRSGQAAFAERHAAEIKKQMFPTVGSLRAHLRSRGMPVDGMPGVVESKFRELHEESWRLPVTKNYLLERTFELGEKVGAALSRRDWTFAWAGDATSFVTSDTPFVLLDAGGEIVDPFTGRVGVMSPGTEKVVPLTQQVCLLVGDGPPETRHLRLDGGEVRALNLKQSRHRDRWLIARDEALLRRMIERD